MVGGDGKRDNVTYQYERILKGKVKDIPFGAADHEAEKKLKDMARRKLSSEEEMNELKRANAGERKEQISAQTWEVVVAVERGMTVSFHLFIVKLSRIC